MLLCTFLGQILYTLHKRDQSKCEFFRLFSAQIKSHQILVIFETKNKFLFKFCTTLIARIGVSTPLQKHHFLLSCQAPLIKVTKFLGKISLFELLVMTEKNIFSYKLFLSLNISDFNFFFM